MISSSLKRIFTILQQNSLEIVICTLYTQGIERWCRNDLLPFWDANAWCALVFEFSHGGSNLGRFDWLD